MKRVLTFLAVMLLPLSLMAMTPISDATMSKVTGQSGVSMNFDFTLDMSFDKLGWGDSDGSDGQMIGTLAHMATFAAMSSMDGTLTALSTYTALTAYTTFTEGAGWIGLSDLKINKVHVWPRSDFSMEANSTDGYSGNVTPIANDGGWQDLQFLTIDVLTVPEAVAELAFNGGQDIPFYGNQTIVNGVTMVRIGVPTLTITMESMSGDVVLGTGTTDTIGGMVSGVYNNGPATPAGVTHNNGFKQIAKPVFNQLMGQFYVGGLNMATGTNGAIYISAHGSRSITSAGETVYGSGVTISLDNVKIDYMIANQLGWGDIDGAYDISKIDTTKTTYDAGHGMGGADGNVGWVGLLDLAIEKVEINGKMVIDVGTCLTGTATGLAVWTDLLPFFNDIYTAVGKGGDSFVAIGFIDGFNITMDQMGATVALGSTHSLDTDQILGNIFVSGMDMTIYNNQVAGNHSFIQIFAH